MADERGIQQTKELLDFIFSLIGAIKESTKDGEFTWSDGLNFIEPLKKIAPAIDDIEEVIPEIIDLDASEWNELVDYVQANFNLDTSFCETVGKSPLLRGMAHKIYVIVGYKDKEPTKTKEIIFFSLLISYSNLSNTLILFFT